MPNIYKKNLNFDLTPLIIIFYLIFWGLAEWTGIEIFKMPFGLILTGYLVGHNFNKVVRFPDKYFGWYGRFAIDIMVSIGMIGLLQVILLDTFLLRENYQIILILLINLILYLLIKLRKIPDGKLSQLRKIIDLFKKDQFVLLVIFTPIFLFLVHLILNPYIFDTDAYLYINIIKKAILDDSGYFQFIKSRPAFITLMSAYHLVCGIGLIAIFKFLVPFFYYIASWILYSFSNNLIKNKYLAAGVYLTSLAVPILVVMAEMVRPEVIIFIFTYFILILSFFAIKDNNFKLLLYVAVAALVSILFHELGFILALVTLLVWIIFFAKYFKFYKKYITVKDFIILLIVSLPYLIIFNIPANIALLGRRIKPILGYFSSNFDWRWWFLDNYKDIGGIQLGWSGISSALYYLYNGILLFLFLAGIIIVFWKKIKKISLHLILAPLFFVFIYFTFAEIFPRMGWFFLPNRAWPHMMIGLSIILVLLVAALGKFKKAKVFGWLLFLLILSGILGSILVSTMIGCAVSPKEKGAINYIKNNIEENAIIVSTASINSAVVNVYGKRDFYAINADKIEEQSFNDFVMDETREVVIKKITNQETEEYVKMVTLSQYKKIISSSKDKIIIQNKTDEEIKDYVESVEMRKPLYLYYSFAKFNSLYGKRQWFRNRNDYQNFEYFANFESPNVVYRKSDGILIRIK